jgi:hypothetical protein
MLTSGHTLGTDPLPGITAVADKDAYPDLEVFAAGVRDELDALAASLRSTQVVARPRRERGR